MAVSATPFIKLTTTCPKCGAKLEFTKSDLKTGKLLGHYDECVYVFCPDCDGTIVVKNTKDGSFESYINFEY